MRTLPGGYDAYNPPGDTDVTKYMEGLDDKQRVALLQNILGEDFDLEKLKANPKDYKKYVKYNTQYRLTASADKMGLKEVA